MQFEQVKQSDMVSGSAYMQVVIHLASLCLLVGAFNPFSFKVIIDMYDPVTVFLKCFGFIFCRSFPSLVFPA